MKKLIVSAVGILVFSIIGFKAIEVVKENSSYISVNGLSDRLIKSDSAVMTIGIICEADEIVSATEKRNSNKKLVKEFLIENGVTSKEISEESPSIEVPWNYKENNLPKYKIIDYLVVKTDKVDLIADLKNKMYKLLEINKGLRFDDIRASYSYSKLSDLRVDMLTEAVKDTEVRAKKIAESAGKQVSMLRNISTGKFIITAADSNFTDEYSWGEEKSLNKRVRIVVQGTYIIK